MFKTYFSFLFIIVLSFGSLTAQSIIQSAILTTGIVTLGGSSQVQINLEQIRLCDTEVTTIDIDHTAKIITVNINYNYNAFCAESFSIISINKPVQPLLEGSYTVNLNLSVPADGSKNEFRTLGSLFVNRFQGTPCSSPPFLAGLCPPVGGSVCGEDGQTYINECDAVFKNRNANYEYGTCGQQTIQNIQVFECNRNYIQSNLNFFSKYNCLSNRCFPGNELIFNYRHDVSGDLQLNYEKSVLTEVILAQIDGSSSIACIEVGGEKSLEVSNLSAGNYLIFVDGETNFNIEFCTTSSIEETTTESFEIAISPNPAFSEINVTAPDFQNGKFEIVNISGKVFKEGKLFPNRSLDLNGFISGTYFLRLKAANKTAIQKFIFEKK